MTTQASAIIPQPFFPRHFEAPFGTQNSAAHFIQSQIPNAHSGLLKNGFEGRQGHTDTLKALKRKLQENFTQTTCKPMKIPRIMQSGGGRSGGYSVVQDSTPLPSSFESNGYRNVINSMVGGMDHHHISSGPMQVMQAQSLANIAVSPKEKTYLHETVNPFSPLSVEKKVKSMEQVVPDVTIPACYPTPEPSPVSSPEPPKTKDSQVCVQAETKFDPVLIAKHLCAIKQKQCGPNNSHQAPRKLLPSLDVSFVDSFFDEISNVSLSREDEIRLLESYVEKEHVVVKKEPVDDCVMEQRPNFPGSQTNFDLEEFLLCSKQPVNEKCKYGMEIKLEKPSDDQQVLSFDGQPSPTPSSPFSSTDEKMTCEDFPSFALTPESNFDSDPYDDVIGSECWDLESVTVDITMPTLTKQTTLGTAPPADSELHQLKQLLSSWTPSGECLIIFSYKIL